MVAMIATSIRRGERASRRMGGTMEHRDALHRKRESEECQDGRSIRIEATVNPAAGDRHGLAATKRKKPYYGQGEGRPCRTLLQKAARGWCIPGLWRSDCAIAEMVDGARARVGGRRRGQGTNSGRPSQVTRPGLVAPRPLPRRRKRAGMNSQCSNLPRRHESALERPRGNAGSRRPEDGLLPPAGRHLE